MIERYTLAATFNLHYIGHDWYWHENLHWQRKKKSESYIFAQKVNLHVHSNTVCQRNLVAQIHSHQVSTDFLHRH